MKILLAGEMSGGGSVAELTEEFPTTTFVLAETPEEQLREIVDADAAIGWMGREAFVTARRLKWLHQPGMGIDMILKSPEVRDSGVVLTHAPGSHVNAMADHVLAVMLSMAHRLPEMMEDQRAHNWGGGSYNHRIVELNGKVLGLLGLGGIGRAVARRALGFGMRSYAIDPFPVEVPVSVIETWDVDRLDELLAMSDWFVITAPLTDATRGLVDARRVGLLKQGAFVAVISRGSIIDEDAVAARLRSGELQGAAFDATAVEPLPVESPLWDLDNVIISPHASGASPERRESQGTIFRTILRRFIAGDALPFTCDLERGF